MHSTVSRFSRKCSSTFGRVEAFSVWPEIELLRDRSCISCQSHCGNAPSITVEKSPSLTMSALSSTLLAHNGDERHFALADGLRFPIEGSLVIVAVRNSVRPNHLFDHNRDHDYFFALPWSGEWDAQSLRR